LFTALYRKKNKFSVQSIYMIEIYNQNLKKNKLIKINYLKIKNNYYTNIYIKQHNKKIKSNKKLQIIRKVFKKKNIFDQILFK